MAIIARDKPSSARTLLADLFFSLFVLDAALYLIEFVRPGAVSRFLSPDLVLFLTIAVALVLLASEANPSEVKQRRLTWVMIVLFGISLFVILDLSLLGRLMFSIIFVVVALLLTTQKTDDPAHEIEG